MSLIESWIYQKVEKFSRDLRQPVPTMMIAVYVGKDPRTIRGYLVRLEQKGYVQRRGQRGGWYPAQRGIA